MIHLLRIQVVCSTVQLHLSATTPMDHCHTLQRRHVSVAKTMGAPVQTGCIATHQNPNAKKYQMRLGSRPAIRQIIPTQTQTLVCAVPPSANPPSMDPIASRPSAVAVVLRENLELTVPTVVKHVISVHLLLLMVWLVDVPVVVLVDMGHCPVKSVKRLLVKIVVLEKNCR